LAKKLSTKSIFERNQNRNPPKGFQNIKIWLHNIRSLHNVGSTFRSADAFGAKSIILSGYTPIPPRPEIAKTALGAEEFVEWSYYDTVSEVVSFLQHENYLLIGLEQTSDSNLISELSISFDSKVCLIFGNEISGIEDDILPYLDHVVEIPQYGRKHSLNISVAVGISLYALHEHYKKNNSNS
jgi:23S rRNA (guanosine2251-2'-O)-methyltransferase